MSMSRYPSGAGLGLRRSFLSEVLENPPASIDFYEVAPENWANNFAP
jgi:uncharacterized protein (UPF0276 family)